MTFDPGPMDVAYEIHKLPEIGCETLCVCVYEHISMKRSSNFSKS